MMIDADDEQRNKIYLKDISLFRAPILKKFSILLLPAW